MSGLTVEISFSDLNPSQVALYDQAIEVGHRINKLLDGAVFLDGKRLADPQAELDRCFGVYERMTGIQRDEIIEAKKVRKKEVRLEGTIRRGVYNYERLVFDNQVRRRWDLLNSWHAFKHREFQATLRYAAVGVPIEPREE